MTPGLVIFDCDGVLVDSEPVINRAHAEILAACGCPIAAEALVERLCGMADAEVIEIIERKLGRPLPTSYAERVEVFIEEGLRLSLAPIGGVAEVVASLSGPVCVASSSSPQQLRRKLDLTGLLGYFGGNLFSAAMVARGKPAPDLFIYAAAQMGTAPERCIVVEDSLAGIEAARAAGMTTIGFCGGSHCRSGHADRLRERGAALVIAERGELAHAIGRLSRPT